MKKSGSANTLEGSFDIIESDKSPHLSIKREHQQTLRRSFSEDLPIFKINYIPTTPPPNEKIKSRSRFSSAFRSLRGTKSSKKSASTSSVGKFDKVCFSEDTSLEDQTIPDGQSSISSLKPKKKKSKLAKKFSLSSIKKYKISPHKVDSIESSVDSGTQTLSTDDLQRQTPEGGNLSISQLDSGRTEQVEPETPQKYENVRKIQITISGKKIETTSQQVLSSKTDKVGGGGDCVDYLTASTEQSILEIDESNNGDRRKSEKINVTESIRDTPPREQAPARPEPITSTVDTNSDLSNELSSLGTATAKSFQSINLGSEQPNITTSSSLDTNGSGKGAIRKNLRAAKLKRQKSREEFFDTEILMRRGISESFDRGKRFPRPPFSSHSIELVTQLHQPQLQNFNEIPASGNSLQNLNLSGSIVGDDQQIDREDLSSVDRENLSSVDRKIQFSVGKAVRPQQSLLIRQISTENKEYSSIESNKSSGSQSPVSEGSVARRRIRYIEQPTLYTDEEREILEGKREGLSYLSGISEYSFDSEFSVDTQIPPFDDLTIYRDEVVRIPIMTSTSTEKREHLYKILVIGELGTGKTSFIKRYVHQFFSQNYRATIGVDFALKVLHWDQNTIVRLQLWDIAGQERFGNMTRVYYKEAVGAFIVFDVTRSGTFDCVSKWKEDLDSKVQLPDGSPIPCILLANKCDQDKQGIATTPEKMDEYVKYNGFAGWFETSAKENVNIEEAARALVSKILLNDKLINAADIADNDKFGLNNSGGLSTSQPSKKTCSC